MVAKTSHYRGAGKPPKAKTPTKRKVPPKRKKTPSKIKNTRYA